MPKLDIKFNEIFDLLPDPIFIIKDDAFIYCNDAAVSIMKYETKQQLLNMKLADISPQIQPDGRDSVEKAKEIFDDVYISGIARFEWMHHKNDGSDFLVELTLSCIDMDNEKLFYMQLNNIDKQFQESLENLEEAQKLANIGHWELDLVNNSLYWSDEVYRIFGLKPQEFGATYESFLEHIHPDDHDLVNSAYTNSLEDKSSYNITHRVLTEQNETKYVEERCIHKFDSDGNVIKSIGTVHDITQRVQHEKKLELASSVFRYSTDAIVITDIKNRIISVNKAYEELTQYSSSEVLGKDPKILSSGWGDKEFYKKMWDDILNYDLWQGEIWDRKKDGSLYAATQSIIRVKDKDNKILNYIGISHDITESKNKEKVINELAFYDFLTKLPNRKLFEQEVDSFMKSSHYSHKRFAILFLDLDNFKWVNDSLGHRFGDKVLVEVSKKISSIISDDSVVARIGGDEFVVLAPFEKSLSISKLASEIINSVNLPLVIEDKEINVGWSIGISLFPENANNYTQLLQNADIAMYEAKAKGKNNFKFFEDEMNKTAKNRLELDTKLRQAVANKLFSLNFQPKYSCTEKKIKGLEALIRWQDPDIGFIPPDKFIPIAEESGYIEEIGLWVMKEALSALKIIQTLDDSITMAINVSGKQLEMSSFYEDATSIISDSGIEPEKIEFEITETAIMEDIQNIIPVLNKIKELGIKISIDDFGTGYSSMVYLKKLPIDTLKIDREFIMELEKDEEDMAIVQTIMALSNALKLKTVAEGVEKLEQKDILESMGCDTFQGYYYSKPLDLKSLLKFISEEKAE